MEKIIYLLIFILPYRMVDLININTFSFKLADFITILVFIYFSMRIMSLKDKYIKFNDIDVMILFYILYSLFNTLVAQDRVLAYADFYRLVIAILPYFIIVDIFRRINIEKVYKLYCNMFKIWIFNTYISAIYSIYIFWAYGIKEFYAFGVLAINSFNFRFRAFYPDPNLFAIYLVISIIFTIHLYKHKEISKRIFILTMMITISSLIFTFSRSGILMFLIYILIYAKKDFKTKKILLYILIFFVVSIFIVSFNQNVRSMILNRVNNTINMNYKKDEAIGSRLLYYKTAIVEFENNPVIGVGRGNFLNQGNKYYYLPDNANPQNLFLQVISELGIVGLIILVLIIFRIFIKYFKYRKVRLTDIHNLLYHILIIYLFSALFGTFDTTKELWYILAFINSSICYLKRLSNNKFEASH